MAASCLAALAAVASVNWLCLARASRLLADARDQHLQISFARAIEATSAAAAAGRSPEPVRGLLLAAIAGAGQ